MKDEGRGMKWFCSGLCVLIFFILHTSAFILAQDEPPTKKTGVQLMFIPPPMEGTVSLGIYDATGKLVRVLHAESPQTEFTAALNGLITFWDGKDDAGKMMPAGKYRARGYVVGAMDFEGVAFLGNDWVTDENSQRVRRVKAISLNTQGLLAGELDVGDLSGGVFGSGASDLPPQKPITVSAAIDQGRLLVKKDGIEKAVLMADGETPLDVSVGFDDTLWAIVKSPTTTEVRAYSAAGEFLRRLAYAVDEPPPVSIKASPRIAEIFLLEQNDKIQRVRGLALVQQSGAAAAVSASPATSPSPAPTSTWKVFFSKTITFSGTLDAVRGLLKFPGGQPFVAQEKIALRLLPNPLEQDKPGAVDISIAVDAKGSFLKAGDGLPLCRVSETPNLRWAAMAREPDSKAITIFQSDGAVVEQFKASRLANMMSFDCGDFDFDPAKLK
jgi:hypothetical protein